MSSTSFAVLAKARAKFGKRLTEKDYNSLLNSNSVAEVMSYLKSYTHYAEALRDINERDVHRGRLEVLLRQHLFYEFDSLCRYDSQMSTGFSAYVISRTAIEQIMRFLTLLNSLFISIRHILQNIRRLICRNLRLQEITMNFSPF